MGLAVFRVEKWLPSGVRGFLRRCLRFRHGDRFAEVAPAGEVPAVGKAAALVGLHRIDGAGVVLEKDAGAVGLVDQGQVPAGILW